MREVSYQRLHTLASEMATRGVFQITHVPTGKVFVGYSRRDMYAAVLEHFDELRKKTSAYAKFQREYNAEPDFRIFFHPGMDKSESTKMVRTLPEHLRLDR